MNPPATWQLLLSLLAATVAPAQVPVPPLASRVTDLAGTLDPRQKADIEARLAAFEARKGSQLAVLILPTTQPETIEQYAIRAFDAWQLGRKGIDDGVLLIVARDDRSLRIEVGRGLEGAVPDAVAKRIVADVIAPRFREGNFYAGISQGVDRILAAMQGETLPAPPDRVPAQGQDRSQWLFTALVAILVAGGLLRAIFGRLLGAGILGAGAGMLGYVFAGTLAGFVIGIIAFSFGLLGGTGLRGSGGWPVHHPHRGGFGGGFGRGGFGGGGFRGGGGGSAGGGASGGW